MRIIRTRTFLLLVLIVVSKTTFSQVGIGTTSPVTELQIYSPNESTILTNFTQALSNGGIFIQTDYTANAYTPGIFWGTTVNNPTKPKAGIFLQETGSGTYMLFGTSNSYATGITNSALVISPTGLLGVGTTSPTEKLHTYIDSNGDNEIRVQNVNAGTAARSVIRAETNSSSGAMVYHSTAHSAYPRVLRLINNDVAGDIRFWVNGSDNMTLEEDGDVGIGTVSPTSKFHVDHNGQTTQAFYVDAGNRSTTQTLFEHSGAATPVPFRITKSGYSGTSATFGILHLHLDNQNVGSGANLHFTLDDDGGNATEYGGIGAIISDATDGNEDGDLAFYTTNAGSTRQERMRISSIGNVGIGSSPDVNYNLTIGGSANGEVKLGGTGTLGVTNNRSGVYWHTTDNYAVRMTQGTWSAPNYQQLLLDWPTGIELNPGNAFGKSYVRVSNGTDAALASGGYFVLGATNSLNIAMDDNEIMARSNGSNATLHLNAEGGDVHIHTSGAASEDIIFKDDGKVGLGTTAPSEQLHVEGSIRMVDGAETSGDIMRSDANGVASWVTPASLGLGDGIYGGDGTTPADVDVTVTDHIDFDASTLFIDGTNNRIGIKTTTPANELEVAGWIGRSQHNLGGLVGSYNNIAPNDLFTNPIYIIGSNYKPTTVVLNNMYGVGYTHTNASFVTAGSGPGWGQYIASDGDARIWLGAGTGSNSYFNTTGNFGIGTNSPTEKLHVSKSTNGDNEIRIHNANAGTAARSVVRAETNSSSGAMVYHSTAHSAYPRVLRLINNDAAGDIRFWVNGSDNMTLEEDGDVGIGTVSPATKFHISSTSVEPIRLQQTTAGTPANYMSYYDTGGRTGWQGFGSNGNDDFYVYNETAGGAIRFATNSTDRLWISSSGDVGIGNTAPSETFHVTGTLRFASNGEAANRILVSDANGVATWQDASATNTNSWQLDGNGGTNPASDFIGTTNAVDLVVRTNSTERMRVEGTGNVGIGTTTPSELLDVNGNINIPTTTASVGQIKMNGSRVLHAAGGVGNIFMGNSAGNLTLTGAGNTILGRNAAAALTNGAQNTAVGDLTLVFETTGDDNVAIGSEALKTQNGANDNTAVGRKAGLSLTTGSRNSVLGSDALDAENTGNDNVAIGYQALSQGTGLVDNVAVGSGALFLATSGDDNVAIGKEAMGLATTGGSDNVAVGENAMRNAGNKGTGNVAIGSDAYSAGTGSTNIIIGNSAGTNLTTGSSNIIIGASNSATSAIQNNQLDIGDLIYGDFSTQNVSVGVTPFANYKFGVSTSVRERAIYAENTYTGVPGTRYAVYGSMTGSHASLNSYAVYGSATGTTNQNFGVAGVASNGGSSFGGQFFALSGTNSWGVQATASSSTANSYGVQATGLGGVNNYGLRAQGNGGTLAYGVYAEALSGTTNYGLFVAQGQTKITDAGAGTPTRTADGSIATSTSGGNRIYFRTGATNYYVNSSGTGDYSEYFRRSDQSLEVGEIVAIDPTDHNAVRRADISKGDGQRIMGIVSKYGTQNNNTNDGDRYLDSNYVNIGLLGQVQLKVSSENGAIQPGDAVTLSPTQPGLAVKANESCRIIGYAMTHFPYIEGEETYPTHTGTKLEKDNLEVPHVMAFVQAGNWQSPKDKSEEFISKKEFNKVISSLQKEVELLKSQKGKPIFTKAEKE